MFQLQLLAFESCSVFVSYIKDPVPIRSSVPTRGILVHDLLLPSSLYRQLDEY